jgi:hypothetical protein
MVMTVTLVKTIYGYWSKCNPHEEPFDISRFVFEEYILLIGLKELGTGSKVNYVREFDWLINLRICISDFKFTKKTSNLKSCLLLEVVFLFKL